MNIELAPQFIQNIDWDLFKKQRLTLYKIMEEHYSDKDYDDLEGIKNILDGLCDYAADICEVPEEKVFLQIDD